MFLGRSGAGKGVQTEYLAKYLKENKLDFIRISTGDLGRKIAKQRTIIGKWVKGILDRGDFFPDWLAIHIWLEELEKRLISVDQIVIFEGTPRKVLEAKMVDELMVCLDRELPIPIYLDVDNKEAMKRLILRRRADDVPKAIKRRLENFKENVLPIISGHYKKRTLKIDGIGTELEVWERILAAIK